MPHGIGHVGGLGFRGGGFRGGGFHHHRFGHHHLHHHHRRHYGGGWWWWGRPGYYYENPAYYAYRRAWSCACFWIWLVVFLVIVAIAVGVYFGSSSSSRSANDFTPGATRIMPSVDSTFCSRISLSGSNPSLLATLYSLSSRPILNGWNNFTLQETASVPFIGHAFYQFFMRKGSTANGTSCIPTSSSVSSLQLLIIRGKSNFDSWVNSRRSSLALNRFTISARCPVTNSFTFTATTDDYFYFVYYNSFAFSGSVTVNLQFHRKEYTVDQSAIINSCLYGGSSCSIPTSAGATYLLVVDDRLSALITGDFSTGCVANGGIIAVIVIVPLLVLALVVGVFVAVFCCWCYKHTKRAKEAAPATPSAAPASTVPLVQPAPPEAPPGTYVNVNTTPTAPPPYSPNYPTDGTAPYPTPHWPQHHPTEALQPNYQASK